MRPSFLYSSYKPRRNRLLHSSVNYCSEKASLNFRKLNAPPPLLTQRFQHICCPMYEGATDQPSLSLTCDHHYRKPRSAQTCAMTRSNRHVEPTLPMSRNIVAFKWNPTQSHVLHTHQYVINQNHALPLPDLHHNCILASKFQSLTVLPVLQRFKHYRVKSQYFAIPTTILYNTMYNGTHKTPLRTRSKQQNTCNMRKADDKKQHAQSSYRTLLIPLPIL